MTLTNKLTSGLTDGLVSGLIKSAGGVVSFPAWDLSNAAFSQELSVIGATPHSFCFNPDGTQFLMINNALDNIHEYTLSTGYDLSTATLGGSFSVSTQENNPRTISYNGDGTAVFVTGLGSDAIFQYTLPTPYTLSGISYASKTSSIAANSPTCVGGTVSYDGNHFYVSENSTGINQYSFGTVFDASTVTYASKQFNYVGTVIDGATAGSPRGIAVHPNGTQMMAMDQTSNKIHLFTLTIPFDISTTSYTSSLDVSGQDITMNGIEVTNDGTLLFAMGSFGDKLYKYTL